MSAGVDPRLASLAEAPYLRPLYLRRVAAVIERYEGLVELGRTRSEARRRALTMSLLYEHPSAHLEQARVPGPELEARLEAARQELIHLRAAAPLPAPADRPERAFVLAVGDVEWLMRELRLLRRAARRGLPDAVAASYAGAGRPDPLPDVDGGRVRAIALIPRGHLLRVACAIAGGRHGVDELRGRLVPPRPRAEGPRRRVHVCGEDAIREGCSRTVEADGRTIAVFRDGGVLKAIDDFCPHRGGPLNEGEVVRGAVICPLHGWAFELDSGRMRGNPRVIVATYEVAVESGEVFVGEEKPRG